MTEVLNELGIIIVFLIRLLQLHIENIWNLFQYLKVAQESVKCAGKGLYLTFLILPLIWIVKQIRYLFSRRVEIRQQ